jgi:hypothetical protein
VQQIITLHKQGNTKDIGCIWVYFMQRLRWHVDVDVDTGTITFCKRFFGIQYNDTSASVRTLKINTSRNLLLGCSKLTFDFLDDDMNIMGPENNERMHIRGIDNDDAEYLKALIARIR